MGNRARLLWIFGVFLLVVSRVVLANTETFMVKRGETKFAMVKMGLMHLDLDPGPLAAYRDIKMFSIIIGGINMTVAGYSAQGTLHLKAKVGEKEAAATNVTKVEISPFRFTFLGGNINAFIDGPFKFTEMKVEGKPRYTVSISISNDAPEGFRLSSSSNDVGYAPNQPAESAAKGSNLHLPSAWVIGGMIAGAIVVVFLISGSAGFTYYRFVYKPKKIKAGAASNKDPADKNGPNSVKTPQAPSPNKEQKSKGEAEEHIPTEQDKLWDEYVAKLPSAIPSTAYIDGKPY